MKNYLSVLSCVRNLRNMKKGTVMAEKMETTSRLAEFIVGTSYKDIPKETMEFSKQLILRCLGGALAGAGETSVIIS